jgi:2-methylcitrate dehydratase PrpD
MNGATRGLAHWAATVSSAWSDEVFEIGLHSLEDTVISMIAGAGNAGSSTLRGVWATGGPIPVVGCMTGAQAPLSALCNGYSGHCEELDENLVIGLGHFGVSVVPAALAIAHELDLSVDRVIDALIVSSEIMARIGMCMEIAHVTKGWHGTSTVGSIAAAAACGRLLRLDAEQMAHAFSIAVSTAAGPKAQFGTDVKPFHPGWAAMGGLVAAKLAAAGLTGNPDVLEARFGFGELYAGDKPVDWSQAVPEAGRPLAIQWYGFAFKLWPNCASAHYCMQALQELMAEHGFGADDVERIDALVGEVNVVNLCHTEPRNAKEAQFSMNYALACILRFGSLSLADFTPEAITNAHTRSLMRRIEMKISPLNTLRKGTALKPIPHQVIVHLRDGQVRKSREVAHLKGSPQNPLTREERQLKFEECTSVMPIEQARRLRALLEGEAGVRELMEQLRFAAEVSPSRFARR